MDLSRLPFIRLYDFWRNESAEYKAVWSLGMGLLGLTVLAILWLMAFPATFGLDINLVSEAEETLLPLWSQEYHGQTYVAELPVYRQTLSYSASPILPEALPMWGFVVLQALGWALILATAAGLQSYWTYGFFLAYGLFLHLSGIAPALAGPESLGSWGLEFVWIMGALVFAYAGQVGWLSMRLAWRWLLLAVWTLLPMLLAGSFRGWLPLQGAMADSFPMLLVVALGYVIFAGKDPVNLLVLLGTNRRDVRQRMHPRILLLFVILLLILEGLWLLDTLNVLPMESILLVRPMHLFLLSSLFLPATSLNQFAQTKKVFPRSSQLSLALLAWSIIVLSFLAVNLTVMDPMLLLTVERLIAILFFSVGVGHVIFLYSNHWPLFSRKAHLYFLMTRGPKSSMYVVWLIGMVGLLAAEGSQDWKSVKLFAHVYFNHQADNSWLAGDAETAEITYTASLANSPISPKANYNLAFLALKNPSLAATAVGYYETSTELMEFPPARINGAQLLAVQGYPDRAIALLRAGKAEGIGAAERLNNLGVLYKQQNEPDSAVLALQQALLLNDQLSPAAVNLAEVYRTNGRMEEANKFIQLALESRDLPNAVRAAAIEFALSSGSDLKVDPGSSREKDPLLWYHALLQRWHQGDTTLWQEVQVLGKESEELGPNLLNLIRQFEQDSIDFARSRAEFLSEAKGNPAQAGWSVLGLAYLDRGVEEMAEFCFRQAVGAGSARAGLYEASLMMETGQQDSAWALLGEVRLGGEELWEEANRLRAMLLLARGQDLFAGVEYDLSRLTASDWVRVIQLADSGQQYIPAIQAARRAQALDTSLVDIYLELGRIYLRYGDSLAIPNLEAGLVMADSSSPALRVALAEANLRAGRPEEARRLLGSVPDTSRRDLLLVKAELATQAGDTLLALRCYRDLYAANILDTEAIVGMFDLMEGSGNLSEANELITTALEFNRRSSLLWYRYARVSEAWGFRQDAGFGAAQAIQFAESESFRNKVAQEFEEELRTLAE